MDRNYPEGRIAIYTGAMSAPAGPAIQIHALTTAVFATLQYQFPYTQAVPDGAQVDPATAGLTLPALGVTQNVKSFKLTSGTIEVIFVV